MVFILLTFENLKSSSLSPLYFKNQPNLRIMMPPATRISPIYCPGLILFFCIPNQPNLSIARLLAKRPQMLVTNKTPIPVLDAKNANPVTKIPPIIPPSHDHHGLSNEKIRGILILLEGTIKAIRTNKIVAVKKETKAAWTEEYNPIDSKLFIDGCMAKTAPPLKPIICQISTLSLFTFCLCQITINIPAIMMQIEMKRWDVKTNCWEFNHPKLSMKMPMTICPNIGIKAVCMAPSFGKIKIFTVKPHKPQAPPSQDHHGSEEKIFESKNKVPFSINVIKAKKNVPIEKETNDAIKGEMTYCLSLELAAV